MSSIDQAQEAFAENGVDGYWETLSKEPASAKKLDEDPVTRTSSGYSDKGYTEDDGTPPELVELLRSEE